MLVRSSLILLTSVGAASAFTTPVSHARTKQVMRQLKSAVVAGDVNGAGQPQAWDCDDEANCVQVDACDEEQCRTTLDVRIHGEWYDLSGESITR